MDRGKFVDEFQCFFSLLSLKSVVKVNKII